MAEKKPNIKKKAKSLFKAVKDTLVQEDNPNSPHKVFDRMNQNMLGDSATTEATSPEKDANREREKNNKLGMLSPEKFDKLIWGDDK